MRFLSEKKEGMKISVFMPLKKSFKRKEYVYRTKSEMDSSNLVITIIRSLSQVKKKLRGL